MNRFFVIVLFILGASSANAQIHEIGVFLGGANYIGEIGSSTYIAPTDPAIGIVYKWNRSPRHSWRFSLIHGEVSADDSDSKIPARKQRNLKFENDITEFSAGLEFDFFDFNLHESEPKITPFVYSGLSYALYKGLFFAGNDARYDATHGTLAIPMTLGIKGRLLPHLILAVESGARFTLADDLDGSNPGNNNLADQRFGNLKSNDWYVFTGITLTYTFGNKPCFCAD
jgi:hypothetical protein